MNRHKNLTGKNEIQRLTMFPEEAKMNFKPDSG